MLASPQVSDDSKKALTKIYLDLNPAQLKRELVNTQNKLLKVSSQKIRKEVKPTYDPAHNTLHSWRYADIIREATG